MSAGAFSGRSMQGRLYRHGSVRKFFTLCGGKWVANSPSRMCCVRKEYKIFRYFAKIF